MRARKMSASRWVTRAGSRLSAISAASLSAMPIRRSASANSITPPSELMRPPSNAAVTFLRCTDGSANGSRLSSVMAGVAESDSAGDWRRHPNLSLQIRRLRYIRQRIPALRRIRRANGVPIPRRSTRECPRARPGVPCGAAHPRSGSSTRRPPVPPARSCSRPAPPPRPTSDRCAGPQARRPAAPIPGRSPPRRGGGP
jgi:hypothetical protein